MREVSFAESWFSEVGFEGASLVGADFSLSTLEFVSFAEADLGRARFINSLLIEVDFSGAVLDGCDFSGVRASDISILVEGGDLGERGLSALSGVNALGYLSFCGALVDAREAVTDVAFCQFYSRYPIVEKVFEKLNDQTLRQRRGLEQRGSARADTPFARDLVELLLGLDWVRVPKGRQDILETTELGRNGLSRWKQAGWLPPGVVDLLKSRDS